jgi:hypothetical protein
MKILPAQAQLFRLMLAALMAMVVALLAGCQPNEQQIAAAREEKRLECLNKFCQGDVDPRQDYIKDALLKFNGQWYIGPKEYFSSGINGAYFFWWKGVPLSSVMQLPEQMHALLRNGKSDEISIKIFLRGRQEWPDPKTPVPRLGKGGEGRFEELQKAGFRMERQQLHPNLERVRFFDAQGVQYRMEYFLATQQKRPLDGNAPGIACELYSEQMPGNSHAGCTGGFFWQDDIYADFRLHAQHANDWPQIYQEIIRVLQLLKKA